MPESPMPHYKIIPVIMSGGSGTRLWPLSTSEHPKQFHAIGADRSMILETVDRVTGAHGSISFLAPIIICNAQHEDLVQAQLLAAGVTPMSVILEPVGRNTAATAALGALAAVERDPEALVLLLPADHLIGNPSAFREAIARAAPLARDRIVTFGMKPSGPETGYGYIESGPELADGVLEVSAFKEKPERVVAEGYLAKGGYYWNGGIFLYHPDRLIEEFAPSAAILEAVQAAWSATSRDGGVVRLDSVLFAATPSEPIDIAVMEKTRRAAVAPCDIDWYDVGSWAEVWRVSDKDSAGNATSQDVSLIDVGGCLVRSEGPKVAIAGLTDLIIVATPEAVLVVPRDRAQDVKKLWALATGG